MPRARWWVIGALSAITVLVVLLDVSGVLFEPDAVVEAAPVTPPETATAPAAPAVAQLEVTGKASLRQSRAFSAALEDTTGGVTSYVAPLSDPTDVWAGFDDNRRQVGTPASTLKLLTAMAALSTFE